ncbi:MAG: hypothetical protein JWM31_1463 [Solirubrobacterales bacterium]|nr:hypothetical protein [Solirubrobacterales bacterium]
MAARATVDRAIASGVPVRSIYLDVLTPAMHRLGVLWEEARIGIADEHLATAITQGVLATLHRRLPRTPPATAPDPGRVAPVAVLGCGPEDLHGLGARMVGDFLEAAGWRVMDLGANAPAEAFAATADVHGAALVAVSSSRAEDLAGLSAVRRAIDRLDRPPLLAVGGLAHAGSPTVAAAVGADLFAPDPAALIALLHPAPTGRAAP